MNLDYYIKLIDDRVYKTGNKSVKYMLKNPVDV